MAIAFLTSGELFRGEATHTVEQAEHALQLNCLRDGLTEAGHALTAVSWDDPSTNWSEFDAVIVGTTWDYHDRLAEFLSALSRIAASKTQLFNPLELVRWNCRKRYLRDLEASGIRTIPTIWSDRPYPDDFESAFEAFGTDKLVVKREVSASSANQFILKPGDPAPDSPHPTMIQPFIPSIETEGEFSFIMIGGDVSHTLIKTPRAGDYRIQAAFGGREARVTPEKADVKAATRVLGTLPDQPLFARVDMVRAATGELMLMELELIEPYLYPEQSSDLGQRFARELLKQLHA